MITPLCLLALSLVAAQEAKLPDSLQYFGKSVEFPMAQKGAFLRAQETLLPRLAKQRGDWAVVLDVDETVLDNFEYGLRVAKAGVDDADEALWNAWAMEGKAKAVPGAKDFLDKVRALIKARPKPRGRIVFITNRWQTQEKPTRDNLTALGLLAEGDALLLRKDKADNKEKRRACVTAGKTGPDARCGWEPLEIVALVGDSFRDFFELHGRDVYEKGRPLLEDCVDRAACFVIPNPMYGQWQAEPGSQPYE